MIIFNQVKYNPMEYLQELNYQLKHKEYTLSITDKSTLVTLMSHKDNYIQRLAYSLLNNDTLMNYRGDKTI